MEGERRFTVGMRERTFEDPEHLNRRGCPDVDRRTTTSRSRAT